MIEYRITRPDLYPAGSPGFNDASARDGHYIRADKLEDAMKSAQEKFPAERLEVQKWKDLGSV